MGLVKPQVELTTVNSVGLKDGKFLADLEVDLHAEAKISELASNFYKAHSSLFPGLNENQLAERLSDISKGLSKNFSMDDKLEILSMLLSKTAPIGPMSAENYQGKTIGDFQDKNDPRIKLAIMQTSNGVSVLDSFALFGKTELSESLQKQNINHKALFTSTVMDFLNTGNTQQGAFTATCGATCGQSHQFNEDPACIIKRIYELSTTGKSGSLTLPYVIPTDDRTLSNSLYQSALMNAADGGYDPQTDMVKGKVGFHKGLFSRQLWEVLNEGTGKPHQIAYKGANYEKIIGENLAERMNLVAVVSGIGAGDHLWHDVRIIDHKTDPVDGKKYVYFLNPWPEEYLKDKIGLQVINPETGLCRMEADIFLGNTEYIAYETKDPADFNRQPAGYDEKDYKAAPTRFFTVSIAAQDYIDPVQEIRRLQEIKDRLETKKKPGSEYDTNYERLRRKFLGLEGV